MSPCRNARRLRRLNRRGATLFLVLLLLVPLLFMVAFSVDIGYLLMARSQLQSSADSAALAACWELVDDNAPGFTPSAVVTAANARAKAVQFAGYNSVCAASPSVSQNGTNNPEGDVVIGYLSSLTDPSAALMTNSSNASNAVQVKVRKASTLNGVVPFHFGKLTGSAGQAMEASAMAALVQNVGGFQAPGDGSNLELLPFALDETTWNSLVNGCVTTDNWKYTSCNSGSGGSCGSGGNSGCGNGGGNSGCGNGNSGSSSSNGVTAGCDGVKEVNLFPQGTGSPGNRGTVDIGSCNNSTNDIARQIVSGISPSDLAYVGGSLKFNSQGKLYLNGDTGISAGVKDELASIIGKPRIIPIFSQVNGPGNNATYTIVKFVGVRIMEVQLTGAMSNKRVIIQPANVIAKGAIPGETGNSTFVYSPVRLVR